MYPKIFLKLFLSREMSIYFSLKSKISEGLGLNMLVLRNWLNFSESSVVGIFRSFSKFPFDNDINIINGVTRMIF